MQKITIFFIAFCLFLLSLSEVAAQQDARYSQYMFNGLVLNPGYAGSAETTCLAAIFRQQWVAIEGAPRTVSLSGHTSLGRYDKIGLGGFAEYDEIGVHQRLRAYASYAYRLRLGGGKLGVGVQGGLLYMRSDWSEITPEEVVSNPDPVFAGGDVISVLPNFGLGLHYQTRRYFVGASVPHLLNNKFEKGVEKLARQARHYMITSGIIVPVGNFLKIKPSFLVKMIPGQAPTQVDANLSFLLKEKLWLGSSFRFQNQFVPESIDFIASFQMPNGLRLGYAYDLTLTRLSNYTSGSHEIMLGFDFGKDGERYRSPRYF